jgi:hypothetical protein
MSTRLTRRPTRLALTLGLALGGAVGVQPPADAATVVSFCFRYSTGAAYSKQPVFLQTYPGQQTLRRGTTNSAGCGTFYRVPSGQPVWVFAHVAIGNATAGILTYSGGTPNYANAGAGRAYLGSGTVVQTSCTPGLYTYCTY